MAKRGPKGKKSPELIQKILHEFEKSSSISTQSACKLHKLSSREWWDWCDKDAELAQKYARAKERQAEMMAQEIITIADDTSEDEIFSEADDKSGKSAKRWQNSEFINRSRLRVDARKWVAAHLLPKKYGDKVSMDIKVRSIEDVIAELEKE